MIGAIYARGFWPSVYLAATIGFMAVIGALVKYGGRSLSDAIYFVTGIVLLAYTIETWRLRREAQLQTELQNRPFLSLTAQRFEPAVQVVNIGKGLARNIELAEIAVGSTFRISAPPITHLGPSEMDIPRLRVAVSAGPEDPFTDLESKDPYQAAANILTTHPVSVTLTYASIVGQRYSTTITLAEGITVRITDDRRLASTEKGRG